MVRRPRVPVPDEHRAAGPRQWGHTDQAIVVLQGVEQLDMEYRIDAVDSRTALWVMPTNEELIVARQAKELLEG